MSTEGTVIELTTGSETIEWAMAKVAAFVHDRGEEEFISKSDKAKRVGPLHRSDAVPGIHPDLSGQWWTGSYEVKEGTLIKLYAKVKASKFGSVGNIGTMILRARKSAPLHRIRVALTGHRLTAVKELTVNGRFDVLTLDEAKKRYGFKRPEKDDSNYSKTSVDSVFRLEEMAEGMKRDRERVTEAKVQVGGGEVKVVTVKKVRKLGL